MKIPLFLSIIFISLFSWSQKPIIKKTSINTYFGIYKDSILTPFETIDAYRVKSFDKNGQHISTELLDSMGGKTTKIFSYEYNDNGLLLNEIHLNGNGTEVWNYIAYSYNSNDKILTKTFCDSIEKYCNSIEKYSYDSQGNLIKKDFLKNDTIESTHILLNSKMDNEITVIKIEEYVHDKLLYIKTKTYQNGLLISLESENMAKKTKTNYFYDESGKIISEKFGSPEQELIYCYQYDRHGNPTIIAYISNAGIGEIQVISHEYY